MDKATLLTASRVELGASVNPRSDLIRLLGPALEAAFRFQNLISSISLFICVQAWFLASVTLVNVVYASKILALQASLATKVGASHGYAMSNQAAAGIWNSRVIQKLRQKLWYEFALFILGSGNTVITLFFWPGWWVLGGASWCLWLLFG
ncbi:hypothetical protein AK830_g9239 [Neonectria ditissima]|uniref:Uncharacterized protein n=1 Tax=Neonectria ditissima TaxID=78410 RepID=A0A0P7B9I5_9HYPO|nr:hypothetical protein AK830_g9239 [Neonectria ditissima]